MARFQSVGITQYFQMSVKRGSGQLMTGAPPDLSSSAVIDSGSSVFFQFSNCSRYFVGKIQNE